LFNAEGKSLELLANPEMWLSLLTLTALEIVLGIDNIIFISILAAKLPVQDRDRARKVGLMGALVTRLLLLSTIAYIVRLTQPLATIAGVELSGKSLILIAGGLFLMFKATREIHEKIEGHGQHPEAQRIATAKFHSVILQIMLLDIVFSLDSVITAVGMSQFLSVMVAANIIALGLMLIASKWIADFVEKHPTIKVLALSFLLMIGLVLVADGVGFHIPKGYVYFSMAFSVVVESINLRVARVKKPHG